jgi:hypothetical protein
MWGYELERSVSRQGQVAGTCECGNEPSGSIKCGEFLDYLRTGYLFKKDPAAWSKYVLGSKEAALVFDTLRSALNSPVDIGAAAEF